MKTKIAIIQHLVCIMIFISSCNNISPVLVLRPLDFIIIPFYYIIISFFFAGLLKVLEDERTFKSYVIRNLCFTPLYGLIQSLKIILKSL